MKLVSVLVNRKVAVTALVAISFAAFAGERRVFWNKFEISVNEKNEVVLTWNVTEYNNRTFHIQHSNDGTKWEEIAVVQSKNSPQTMVDYTYTQHARLKGKQFYRLQDVDVDQNPLSLSPVRTLIVNNDTKAVSIWPNPATTEINLAGHDSDNSSYARVQIYDLSGRKVAEKQFIEHSNTISVAGLKPGTYILRIQNDSGAIHDEKFVKQ
jgi:hypothetical protein